jgi:hypothetical protein
MKPILRSRLGADRACQHRLGSVDAQGQPQLLRVIRDMKVWRSHKYVSLKSIVLELMATDYISRWDKSRM